MWNCMAFNDYKKQCNLIGYHKFSFDYVLSCLHEGHKLTAQKICFIRNN